MNTIFLSKRSYPAIAKFFCPISTDNFKGGFTIQQSASSQSSISENLLRPCYAYLLVPTMPAGRKPRQSARTTNPNYYDQLKENHGRTKTSKAYKCQLKNYFAYCQGANVDPENLNEDLADVISRWLAHRVMYEGCGKSTFDQCYSAVKQYYWRSTGEKVITINLGRWEMLSNGGSKGNPEESIAVDTVKRYIRKETAGDKTVRSLPISYEDLGNIKLNLGKLDSYLDETRDFTTLEKTFLKALFATCFYCWFRMDEAATLTFGDVDWFITAPQNDQYVYHTIHLDHR